MIMSHGRATPAAVVLVRVALAASFFSAVADRFGLWGEAGDPGVAWGSFDPFLDYTGKLLWFLPPGLIPAIGWTATVLEVALGVGLVLGVLPRLVAALTGLLLTTFAITMTAGLGPEAPLSYSVWTAAAASFLLASLRPVPRPKPEIEEEHEED